MYNHFRFLSECIQREQDKNHEEALQAISYFGAKEDPERVIQRVILDKRDERNREMSDCQDTLYAAFQALAKEKCKNNQGMLDFWCVK